MLEALQSKNTIWRLSFVAATAAPLALSGLSDCSSANERTYPITQHELDCVNGDNLTLYVDHDGEEPYQHHRVDIVEPNSNSQIEIGLPNTRNWTDPKTEVLPDDSEDLTLNRDNKVDSLGPATVSLITDEEKDIIDGMSLEC